MFISTFFLLAFESTQKWQDKKMVMQVIITHCKQCIMNYYNILKITAWYTTCDAYDFVLLQLTKAFVYI